MTEQDKKYVIEALEYALHKCIDADGNTETHYNTLANAIEVVKNCSIPNVGGSTSLSENEIEEQIAMEEYEDSLWNDVDDLDGVPYPEVDETLFAIESNFPPSNLTEEQWNKERS